jgi:hypothetical protein
MAHSRTTSGTISTPAPYRSDPSEEPGQRGDDPDRCCRIAPRRSYRKESPWRRGEARHDFPGPTPIASMGFIRRIWPRRASTQVRASIDRTGRGHAEERVAHRGRRYGSLADAGETRRRRGADSRLGHLCGRRGRWERYSCSTARWPRLSAVGPHSGPSVFSRNASARSKSGRAAARSPRA